MVLSLREKLYQMQVENFTVVEKDVSKRKKHISLNSNQQDCAVKYMVCYKTACKLAAIKMLGACIGIRMFRRPC